ncbi:protein FAM57B isoform X1 [Oryzias latipes]|uniref:protein FAM57B isoform X1 n=1 Tax=Oryzias latipes TaxID=8090 RepID=UPI0009DB64E1|nr:protein FAM57B isoform X1 [Oryzias latipes]
MLALLAAGSVFFPGLFLVSRRTLQCLLGWSEGDAVIVSSRLVSSLQAIMASSAGCVIASSCRDILEDGHWLTNNYILFATPYFLYDIYAMFVCYWHKMQVKGHEEAGRGGLSMRAALPGYLRREILMVLHHVFMVAFCFPASLLWRRGKGDYFQGVLFLAELSTPSVCLGKVLIQEAADAAAQGQRRLHAAVLLLLPRAALPVPVLRLQQVRLHPAPPGPPGGPLAVQPGGGSAVAPAALLVLSDLQGGPAADEATPTHRRGSDQSSRLTRTEEEGLIAQEGVTAFSQV